MRLYVSQSQFRSALSAHGEGTAVSNALSLAETVVRNLKLELFQVIIWFLFAILILALVITVVTDLRGVVGGIYNMTRPTLEPGSWVVFPIWLLLWGLDKLFGWKLSDDNISSDDKSEDRYRSSQNLNVPFANGTKLLFVKGVSDLTAALKEFTQFAQAKFQTEDFVILDNKQLVKCPDRIGFYDYNLLVQHINNEFGQDNYGVFISPDLSYYLQQDKHSLHNLVGSTFDGRKFSVYTLDDLDKKVHLRLNSKLKIKPLELKEIKTAYNNA